MKELEISNYSKFKETTSYIPVQGTDLNENSQKLKTAINKRGEIRHREIDIFIRNLKPDIEEMAGLKRQEDELTGTITEIIQCIAELNKLLHYKNVCLVSEYKSRKDKFRRVPTKHKVSLPNFRSQEIHMDQLIEQFGYLTALDFKLENQD